MKPTWLTFPLLVVGCALATLLFCAKWWLPSAGDATLVAYLSRNHLQWFVVFTVISSGFLSLDYP